MFYSNEHEPIYVHGKYQGFESKAEFIIENGNIVKIVIISVKGKKDLPTKELRDFKNFVENFADDIVKKWIDYFVYHKSIKCIKIEGKI
jgi:hypothetical protein